jgi:hypothetical protein
VTVEGGTRKGDVMAGDWIKMRCDLAMDPAVIAIADTLRIDEDLVVGKLHRLWSWLSAHSADGSVTNVRIDWVNKFLGQPGFTGALEAVGWLSITLDGFSIPNWDRHNGQSAKRRAQETSRKALSRKRPQGVRNVSAPNADNSVTREEKRREEKKEDKQDPVARTEGRHPIPTVDAVVCLDASSPDFESTPEVEFLRTYQRLNPGSGHPLRVLNGTSLSKTTTMLEDFVRIHGVGSACKQLKALYAPARLKTQKRPTSVSQAIYMCGQTSESEISICPKCKVEMQPRKYSESNVNVGQQYRGVNILECPKCQYRVKAAEGSGKAA